MPIAAREDRLMRDLGDYDRALGVELRCALTYNDESVVLGAVDPLKDIEHYAQVMKALRIRESAARLAEQARSDGWSHEDYLAAVLSREVTARESSGTQNRIRLAGFTTRKSLK